MPLGQKLQLMPAKGSTVREVEQWRQHLDGAQASCKLNRPLSPGGQPSPRVHSRCMSAEPAAQPSCGICCGVRPCSPSHVHRMLRGRDSPVRSALQDCWMDAARQVKQDAAEAAVRPKAASPSRLDQDTLLATLWALNQAAERLRTKLAHAAPSHGATATATADPTHVSQRAAASRVRSSSTGSHRHRSSQQLQHPRASVRTPSPGRRHWIP